MGTPTVEELTEYMKQLAALEADGARASIEIGPFSAMILVGALQLATRHPGTTETQRARMNHLVEQFRPWFVGTPGEDIMRMGADPELDQ
jgi:hypothetical protein